MISLKSKGLLFNSQSAKCFAFLLPQRQKSHYDTLGVASNASQAEVKSAYYKLSKKYHPDTNVNDPMATKKFQEISEAYEILGNDDSRLRYDKGMAPVDRMITRRQTSVKTPVDPKAAFYKSRLMQKMNTPTTERIYNFDEWTKSHYTASVKSNRVLKDRTYIRKDIKYSGPQSPVNLHTLERMLALILVSIICATVVAYGFVRFDTPAPRQ